MGDYLRSKVDSGAVVFQNPLSVVEFTRIDDENVEFFLRITWGRITNRGLAESMRGGITVSAAEIVSRMSMFWFYDSEPPVVYTMGFLWEKIFPHKLDPNTFFASGIKKVQLNISVDQVMSELDGISGNMPKPKDEWVARALEEMVVMGMAKRTGKFSYEVKYYKLPDKQLLRTLAKKWARAHPDTTLTGFLGRDRS